MQQWWLWSPASGLQEVLVAALVLTVSRFILVFLGLSCSGPGAELLRGERVEAGESQAGRPRCGSKQEDERH